MAKIDAARIVEFISVFIFGFTGFLFTIWNWTKDGFMVVVFALLFLIIIAVSVIGYKIYKEEYLKTPSKKGEEDAEKNTS